VRIAIRGPNWVGDTVLACAVADYLACRTPQATIHIWCRPHLAGLVALNGTGARRARTTIHLLPPGKGPGEVLATARSMHGLAPDAALLLAPSLRAGLEAFLAGAPIRIGYPDDHRAPLLTHTIHRPGNGSAPPFSRHILDEWLDLADTLVRSVEKHASASSRGTASTPTRPCQSETTSRFGEIPSPRNLVRHTLAIPPALRRLGTTLVSKCRSGARGPLVAVAPFVGGGKTRAWPIQDYAAVVVGLATRLRADVVVLGGPSDRWPRFPSRSHRVRTPGQGRTTLLLGSSHLPLPVAAALLEQVDLLVTNDSGLMHVAAALGTPVVALFGPTLPALTGPYVLEARDGAPHVLLEPAGAPCTGCYQSRCPCDQVCLRAITPDQVLESVANRLALPAGEKGALPCCV